jgi:hypothetical protein
MMQTHTPRREPQKFLPRLLLSLRGVPRCAPLPYSSMGVPPMSPTGILPVAAVVVCRQVPCCCLSSPTGETPSEVEGQKHAPLPLLLLLRYSFLAGAAWVETPDQQQSSGWHGHACVAMIANLSDAVATRWSDGAAVGWVAAACDPRGHSMRRGFVRQNPQYRTSAMTQPSGA